jgi:glycosyltransferase domain-containing protein
MDNNDISSRHTLVIPTFNRPELLKKLILYYQDRASWINLLILDSSGTKAAQQNAKTLSIFAAGVSHVVFPENVALASKLSEGLALVRTPYVSFCADDDLVFPNGLFRAISFLQHHDDYVSAHGLYLNFQPKERDVLVSSEYAGPSIEAGHWGARAFRLCQRYESLFYAVYRTVDAQNVFSSLKSIETLLFQELFQSVASVMKGKIKRLPVIYAARQSGPPAEAQRDKWQTYYWFANNPGEVLEHYRTYRDFLWAFYQTQAPDPFGDQQEFVRILDLAHAVYFAAECPPEYFYAQLQPLWPQDPYLRVSRLDMLPEARRYLLLKRALLPDRQQVMDVLEQLRLSSDTRGWKDTGLCGGLRFLCQSLLGYVKLIQLNTGGSGAEESTWRCTLPKQLTWMAANPAFREAYHELRHYLAKPTSSAGRP